MHNQSKRSTDLADRDILRGPPGLLFGLTLLVFAAARLCFGWDSPTTQNDRAVQTVSIQAGDQAEEDAPVVAGTTLINR